LSREARERLALFPWPGNVRELANEIERALLLETGPELELEPLTLRAASRLQAVIQNTGDNAVAVALPPDGIAFTTIERQVLLQALTLCQWNIALTARFLRLSRDTLRYRIERLGLHPAESNMGK
jgi:DNA-binding NtrC family response regulator